MNTGQLKLLRKVGLYALVVLQLGLAGIFTYAFFAADELSLLARMGFVLGVAFALSFAVLLVRIIRRGSYDVIMDANAITGVTWVFLVFLITILMLTAGRMEDPIQGMRMVLNGIVFLIIFGVVGLLQNTINQAHHKTREKLVEIERRIAVLNQRLTKQ